MRTDSTRIAESALAEARKFIAERYPAQLPQDAQRYSSGKAGPGPPMRPSAPRAWTWIPKPSPNTCSATSSGLYALIWERFVASQMVPAVMTIVTADIGVGGTAELPDGLFRLSASSYVEEGFYKVIKLAASKEERASHSLALEIGQTLSVERIGATQHFTQGPARYNDASIIKALEELGIGRPSTYAPTISTLLERYYVSRQAKQLAPTLLGTMISEILSRILPRCDRRGLYREDGEPPGQGRGGEGRLGGRPSRISTSPSRLAWTRSCPRSRARRASWTRRPTRFANSAGSPW